MQDCARCRTAKDGERRHVLINSVIWTIIKMAIMSTQLLCFCFLRRHQLQRRWVTVTVCTWPRLGTLRWSSSNMVNHSLSSPVGFYFKPGICYWYCVVFIVLNRQGGRCHLNGGDQRLYWQPDGWHWEICRWWCQHLQGSSPGKSTQWKTNPCISLKEQFVC